MANTGGDKEVVFTLALDDQITQPAQKAANSLESLAEKIKEDSRVLREMQTAMRALKGSSTTATTSIDKLKNQIAAQKVAVAQTQEKFINLGGSFGAIVKKSAVAGGALATATTAMQNMSKQSAALAQLVKVAGGQANVFGGTINTVGRVLISPIALTFMMGTALVAVSAASVAAAAAVAKFGFSIAQARRDEALRIDGLLRMKKGIDGVTGQSLADAIDVAADATAMGRDELSKYGIELAQMGLHSRGLERALTAAGIAAQAGGDEGAKAFLKEAKHAKALGKSIDEIAYKYEDKFGAIVEAKSLSMGFQLKRLQSNLSSLFRGLSIEKFLNAMREVLQLFSLSTVSGRALKHLLEGMLQPLFDKAGGIDKIIKPFFKGMLISALQLQNTFLRVAIQIKKTFGFSILKDVDKFSVLVTAGKIALFGLVGVLGIATAAIGALAGVLATAFAPLASTYFIWKGLFALFRGIGRFVKWVGDSTIAIGTAMVDGIVRGVMIGASKLFVALRGLADGAMDVFRDKLQIHSPSRVFRGYGEHVSEGFAQGVSGSDAPQKSVRAMAGGVAAAGRPSSNSVRVGDVHVHVNAGGATDARAIAVAVRDELASIFEGVAIEMGAA